MLKLLQVWQRVASYLLNDSISLYIWLVWQEGHSIKRWVKFNCPFIVSTGLVSILTVKEMYFSCTEEFFFFFINKNKKLFHVKRWLFLKQYPICLLQKGVICKYIKNVLRRLSVKNTLIFSILLKECFV